MAPAPTTRRVASLRDVAPLYDVFLFDQFGVLHDGAKPLPGALEAVRELRRYCEGHPRPSGKSARLVIVSNWSGTREVGIEKFKGLGFAYEGVFDDFVCSGELCRSHILSEILPSKPGARALWLGHMPEVRRAGRQDLLMQGIALARTVGEADYILAQAAATIFTGTERERLSRFGEGPGGPGDVSREANMQAEIEPLLEECLQRDLPMLCANPDRFLVEPSGRRKLMVGLVAERYREMGGRVLLFGKPARETFLGAAPELGEGGRGGKVLMIGDAMETDVEGATASGADSLLVVESGVHFGADLGEGWTPQDVQRLGEDKFGGLRPTWATARCTWSSEPSKEFHAPVPAKRPHAFPHLLGHCRRGGGPDKHELVVKG